MKAKTTTIRVIDSLIPGIMPVTALIGREYEAKFSEETGLYYINEPQKPYSGQIGLSPAEVEVVNA